MVVVMPVLMVRSLVLKMVLARPVLLVLVPVSLAMPVQLALRSPLRRFGV